MIMVSHVGLLSRQRKKNLKQKVFLVKGGVLAGVLDVSVGQGAGLEEEKGGVRVKDSPGTAC